MENKKNDDKLGGFDEFLEEYLNEDSKKYHPQTYITEMNRFNSIRYEIKKNSIERYNKLMDLVKENKLVQRLTTGETNYRRGYVLKRDLGKDENYFISLLVSLETPKKLEVSIHTEGDLEKSLEDFQEITGNELPKKVIKEYKKEIKQNKSK